MAKSDLLRTYNIDIVYCFEQKNLSLFLSSFLEACGIFSTRRELKYMKIPKGLKLSSKTIYLLDEESIKDISQYKQSEHIIFCNTNQNDSYHNYEFTKEGLKKILNTICKEWNCSDEETAALNELLEIFIRNDFWNTMWLAHELRNDVKEFPSRNGCRAFCGATFDYDMVISKSIKDSCEAMRSDLIEVKELYNIKSYFDYMLLYIEYIELYSSHMKRLDKFSKTDKLISEIKRFSNYYLSGKICSKLLIAKLGLIYDSSGGEQCNSIELLNELGFNYLNSECISKATILAYQGRTMRYDCALKNIMKASYLDASNKEAIEIFLLRRMYVGYAEMYDIPEIVTFGKWVTKFSKAFGNIPIESYLSIDEIYLKKKCLEYENLLFTQYHPDSRVARTVQLEQEQFHEEIINGKPFENLLNDMALNGERTMENEKMIQEKVKVLCKYYDI